MVRPDVAHTNCQKLARLLRLGTDPDTGETVDPACEKTWALRDCLSSIPPLSQEITAALPGLLQRLFQGMPRVAGQPLSDLIRDPQCTVKELRAAKHHLKQRMESARIPAEREAAEVVCDQKITQHSYQDLEKAFTVLCAQAWGQGELQQLFARAGDICRRKRKL
jgi:hypothetical protein